MRSVLSSALRGRRDDGLAVGIAALERLDDGSHPGAERALHHERVARHLLHRSNQPPTRSATRWRGAVGLWLSALGLPAVPVETRVYDFEFLQTCTKPKLFVSGSRDQFGPMGKLEALVDTFAEPKKLVRIEAGDHFFEGRLREMREAVEAWVKQATAVS